MILASSRRCLSDLPHCLLKLCSLYLNDRDIAALACVNTQLSELFAKRTTLRLVKESCPIYYSKLLYHQCLANYMYTLPQEVPVQNACDFFLTITGSTGTHIVPVQLHSYNDSLTKQDIGRWIIVFPNQSLPLVKHRIEAQISMPHHKADRGTLDIIQLVARQRITGHNIVLCDGTRPLFRDNSSGFYYRDNPPGFCDVVWRTTVQQLSNTYKIYCDLILGLTGDRLHQRDIGIRGIVKLPHVRTENELYSFVNYYCSTKSNLLSRRTLIGDTSLNSVVIYTNDGSRLCILTPSTHLDLSTMDVNSLTYKLTTTESQNWRSYRYIRTGSKKSDFLLHMCRRWITSVRFFFHKRGGIIPSYLFEGMVDDISCGKETHTLHFRSIKEVYDGEHPVVVRWKMCVALIFRIDINILTNKIGLQPLYFDVTMMEDGVQVLGLQDFNNF